MWSWVSPLASGIVSSLIAIALIEIYRQTRRRLTHRLLRRLLGDAEIYGIVSPSYPNSRQNPSAGLGLLTTDNAYALADVIECCRRVGAEARLVPISESRIDVPDNQILVGGHIANDMTRDYLTRYCPGFYPRGETTEGPRDTIWYECGERSFMDTDDFAWSFVIKLARDVTGQDRTILLLFGRSSFGTAEAAHLIHARLSLFPVDVRTSFAVAALTPLLQGYHTPPDRLVDLTTFVFAETAFSERIARPVPAPQD